MRISIAWTMTAAVAASVVATASGQGMRQPGPKRQAGAPATAPAAPPKGASAAKLDPEAIKARQLADQKAREAMVPILAEWEKQSKKVTTLSVGFQRVDKSAAWGDDYFVGRAVLKAPNMACLEFQKCKLDDKGKPLTKPNAKGEPAWVLEPEPAERIVCNSKEVLQYAFAEKVLFVFPLEKEARMRALQEGPLPFLFNMKAAEAARRYGMRLLQEDEREYLIAVVPNDPDDRGNFERAFVWLGKKDFLPTKLRLYPVQGGQGSAKESQEFTFYNIDKTRPIEDAFFNPPTKMKDWQTKVNPNEGAIRKKVNAKMNDIVAPPQDVPLSPRRQAAQPAPKAGGRVQ